jgi:hypothetical protein
LLPGMDAAIKQARIEALGLGPMPFRAKLLSKIRTKVVAEALDLFFG